MKLILFYISVLGLRLSGCTKEVHVPAPFLINNVSKNVLKMKTCSNCLVGKPLNEFSKDRKSKDGLCYICKECNKNKCKEHSRSIDGFISHKYRNQIDSSNKRNHPKPNYSLDEFKKWVLSQHNWNTLWNNWVESGYKKDLSPSPDRLNDYLPYTLNNLQLVTWKENRDKSHRDVKYGTNIKQCTAITQYTKDGVKIRDFHSMHHAQRETNICRTSIGRVCSGKQKTSGGFIWRYKNN